MNTLEKTRQETATSLYKKWRVGDSISLKGELGIIAKVRRNKTLHSVIATCVMDGYCCTITRCNLGVTLECLGASKFYAFELIHEMRRGLSKISTS